MRRRIFDDVVPLVIIALLLCLFAGGLAIYGYGKKDITA